LTTSQLYSELKYVDATREKRQFYAQMVIEDPELIPSLLEILFLVDDKISCRAAWVLEYVCNNNLELILPHLDALTNDLRKVHLDSAVRPVAKICELLVKAFYNKKQNPVKKSLKSKHLESITEVCFDYMIRKEKVAPKAFAMNTLYLLGQDHDWIHPELKIILERDFNKQSAAFKARAKHLMKKLEIMGNL